MSALQSNTRASRLLGYDKNRITTIHRRSPMLEVHLLVEVPQEWIRTMSIGHSALVRITDIRSEKTPDSVQDFVEISAPGTKAKKLIDTISRSRNIKNSDLVQLDQHRIKGVIITHDCPVCSTLAGMSCSLLSASTREDNKMEWKLLISGEDTLKTLTERLSMKEVKYEITRVSHLYAKNDLTARQEQIAKISLELGYFEFPKKIGIEQLAKRLGISAGTLSEILRRAEKNILLRYFEEHSHG